MSIFSKLFKPKSNDINTIEPYEIIQAKPFDSLKYDMVYAKDEILIDDDNITIGVRKYKSALIKIALVKNFSNFKLYDLSNESLKEYAMSKGFLENISLTDFEIKKEVKIVIFKETTEYSKEYCILNSKKSKEYYHQYFTYDFSTNSICNYRMLNDFQTLSHEYKTALYFDLACIDKEME